MIKKLLAICCATIICSSPVIVPQYSNQTSISHVYAAESSYSYTDEYGVTYSFTIDEATNTACLKKLTNAKSDLILPSTVSSNGKSYTVTKLGKGFGSRYSEINSVTIPNTIKSLDDRCFRFNENLSIVKGGSSVNEIGIDTFMETAWENNQKNTKGYCALGKAFIRYLLSNETIDLSSNEFNNIEYICTAAFIENTNAKKLILPKNVIHISPIYYEHYADNNHVYGLEKIEFYDKDINKYVDLHDVCISDNRTAFQESFINNFYESFLFTNLCESITYDYVKKILEQCDIKCIDSTDNTVYSPWEEYQIVRKIYKYIGQNYNNYNGSSDGSISFKSELLIHHGIVCFQYAWMFKYFCDVAGITCEDVAGGGHRWNNVKIGDQWFNVDSCWTWNWSLQFFLTSDDVVKDGAGCHTKKAEYSTIKCTTQIGDVNQDGYINSVDASLIMKAYCSLSSDYTSDKFSSFDLVLCDVNRDGYVNSIDASWVLSYYSYTQTNHDVETTSLEDYMYQNGYYIIAH